MARLNLENTPYKFKPKTAEKASLPSTNSDSEQETAQPVKRKGRRLMQGVRKVRHDDSDEGEKEEENGLKSSGEEEEVSTTTTVDGGSSRTSSSPVKKKDITNESGNGNKDLIRNMGGRNGRNDLLSRFSDLSLLPPQPGSERRKQRSLKSTREKSNTLFQRQGKCIEYKDEKERDERYDAIGRETPRRRTNDTKAILETQTQRSRKQQDIKEDRKDTTENVNSTADDDDDDEFDSLDEFIVGDDEAISIYGDTDEEVEEVEEIEPEILPKTPRRSPRKLFRGRTPGRIQKGEGSVGPYNGDATDAVNNTSPSPLDNELPEQHNEDNRLQSSPESDTRPEVSESSKQLQADIMASLNDNAPDFSAEEAGFITPPASPSKPRLKSPSKSTKKIPPFPHKSDLDSFWDQAETNDWNDKFSPRKIPLLGNLDFKIFEDDDEDGDDHHDGSDELDPFHISPIRPPLTPASKNVRPSKQSLNAEASSRREQAARKREFDQKKDRLAKNFLKELDDLVTDGEVQRLAQSTGGVKITWNKKLATTAGRASWKREIGRTNKKIESVDSNTVDLHDSQKSFARSSLKKTPEPQSSSNSNSSSAPNSVTSSPSSKLASLSLSSSIRFVRHHAGIELAEKIIDSEDRLLNTLAHEYCHLANFMISNVRDQPHGMSFKRWASKCMAALASNTTYGSKVKITTKHSYVINYKYCWGCQACGQEYGRHSKSIDPVKVRCGKCKTGKLLQLRPKPRNVKKDASRSVPQRRAFGEVGSAGST